MFRPQPISSTDARKYFTKLINKVSFSSKSFVIQTYRQPIVRLVNENYIRILEEVLGKKTVNQIMQIAGDERFLEAEKMEQIKKIFQRRLSGSPPQQPSSKGQSASGRKPQPHGSGASPAAPRPSAQNPKPQNPISHLPPHTSNRNKPNRGALLLSNGKNYE